MGFHEASFGVGGGGVEERRDRGNGEERILHKRTRSMNSKDRVDQYGTVNSRIDISYIYSG